MVFAKQASADAAAGGARQDRNEGLGAEPILSPPGFKRERVEGLDESDRTGNGTGGG